MIKILNICINRKEYTLMSLPRGESCCAIHCVYFDVYSVTLFYIFMHRLKISLLLLLIFIIFSNVLEQGNWK